MRTDLTIEIVVLIETASGKNKVLYFSDFAATEPALDLYVSESSRNIALFHQNADSNRALADARNRADLYYPGGHGEKMVYVGQLLNKLEFEPGSHVEVSRAQLHLKNIPVDEMAGVMRHGDEEI